MPDNVLETYSGTYFNGAGQGHGYVDYDRDKIPMTGTFEVFLNLLAHHGVATGRLLDVGAATGFFLDLARKRGYHTVGVEPGAEAAKKAELKGLNVVHGTIDDLAEPPESFDAITMLDVLEHLPAPSTDLARARRLLKPGGLLAINTPDYGSLLARVLGMNWHLVTPPEHLCLFTSEALNSSLGKMGFKVLVVRRIGKKFTLQYILRTLANNQKLKLWDFLGNLVRRTPLGAAGVPINLRDNIFVLARRV